MAIDSKIVQYNIPDSFNDSSAEEYEYFLAWQSPDGGFYSWLFFDFIKRGEINKDTVNTESENITSIFKSTINTVQLVAEDLTKNQIETLKDILRAKIIYRYFKDGSFEELAINSDVYEIRESDYRYNFTIIVREQESPLLK
jgi:hypothetical protein